MNNEEVVVKLTDIMKQEISQIKQELTDMVKQETGSMKQELTGMIKQETASMKQELTDMMKQETTQLKQELKRDINRNTEEIRDLAIVVKSIDNRVKVIEHVHGDKLRALFDAVTGNTQKEEVLEKRVEKLEDITNRHSLEIRALKPRKLAT